MIKEIKIKETDKVSKTLIKDLNKLSVMEKKDNIYIFTDIKQEDIFIYKIAYFLVEILYNENLKSELLKHFNKTKVKEILKNHDEKTYEKNHIAFLLKIKLFLFFKNNNTLNINTFFKFTVPKCIDEIQNIAVLEIDADGDFLKDEDEDEDDKENYEINEEENEKYCKTLILINSLKLSKEKKETKKILDFHIFKDKDMKYHIYNEYNQAFNSCIDDSIDNLVTSLYSNIDKHSKEYISIKLCMYLYCFNPERIILYSSLDNFTDELIKDFSFIKNTLGLDTVCYKSKEKEPRF